MEIKNICDNDLDKYDELAEKYGTIFDRYNWLRLFNNILIFGIYDEGNNLIGGFHLYKEKRFAIKIYRNAPFTPYNGPFIKNDAKLPVRIANKNREILLLISEYFDKIKYSVISVSLGRNINDTMPFIWRKYKVVPRYTYIIDLNNSIEQIYNNISSEKRNHIIKAKSDNAEVRQVFNYNIVKALVLKTFSRQKVKINEKYLDKILFEFANKKNSFAFATYVEEQPVSAAFYIFDATTAYCLLSGYDHGKKHRGAGVLEKWEAIKYSKDRGLKYFDFEGSMIPGIEEFFRSFGGILTPYFRINKAFLPLEIALKLFNRELF